MFVPLSCFPPICAGSVCAFGGFWRFWGCLDGMVGSLCGGSEAGLVCYRVQWLAELVEWSTHKSPTCWLSAWNVMHGGKSWDVPQFLGPRILVCSVLRPVTDLIQWVLLESVPLVPLMSWGRVFLAGRVLWVPCFWGAEWDLKFTGSIWWWGS